MRREFTLTLVALALLALTACDKEPASVHDGERYPILFGNYETRATADLDDLKTNGFKVYAYFKGNTGNSHTFEKEVYYDETNEVWTYDKLEYWIPGAKYWFRAFYPKSGYTLNVNTTTSDLSYTIEDFDITSQLDLMDAEATASVAVGATAPNGGSVVKLQFQHLLANVVVKIKSEIPNVTVSNVSFEGVAQSGKYENEIWTAGQTVSFGKQYTGDPLVKDAENYVDVTSGGILVIPEDINGSQKMYITTSHKVYDFKLQPITWESGMLYTYTLTIKQDNIIFNEPTVEIWDEENATGSVIIK